MDKRIKKPTNTRLEKAKLMFERIAKEHNYSDDGLLKANDETFDKYGLDLLALTYLRMYYIQEKLLGSDKDEQLEAPYDKYRKL